MYTPKLYREEDREKILEFLKRNNFPALVTSDGEKLIATHLPVEVVETGNDTLKIYSHMSRANLQWKSFSEQEALLIFQGAHTYISPTWYNHVNVPTWNYMMVHVYGKARVVDGEELKSTLGRLVERHETGCDYRMESLPGEFVEKELKGAVGFVVDVTRIDAGYKLSQNRNDEDHANIIRELELRGDEESTRVAEAMRRNRPQK
ncbi:MAG: FMN-binding negative transcriptional regulator [Anaerolineales bacterium]|nr:FMN-binding negative transcriptional regulator [Anaerolineales bacterium]